MIGIIGGTGPEGFGLAVRWSMAGEAVGIGSRSPDRAAASVTKIKAVVRDAKVTAFANEELVQHCQQMVVAVPYTAIESVLAPLRQGLTGKLVVSVVAALEWVDGRPRPVFVEEGSVAQKVARLLPHSDVTSGFQTLSAELLGDPGRMVREDCIVCGDDRDSRRATIDLADKIAGVRGVSGGMLENSFYPELIVGLLAAVNRIHKVHAGIRLTGLPDD